MDAVGLHDQVTPWCCGVCRCRIVNACKQRWLQLPESLIPILSGLKRLAFDVHCCYPPSWPSKTSWCTHKPEIGSDLYAHCGRGRTGLDTPGVCCRRCMRQLQLRDAAQVSLVGRNDVKWVYGVNLMSITALDNHFHRFRGKNELS